ncbi:general odorant-binding protein 19d-like [Contarinia nasturtii]|uniref:general odorant-binding protein 19d-like n=1 Tax=Contarinia nasturtii TaxID=265458 RepID=UPI0012D3D3B5|nr:general odorant-binding protein 19d-like [Contarinia nasturtii]
MQAVFTLTIVLGVLIAFTIAAAPSEEKKKVLNECKAQEKATDIELQQILSNKLPQSMNGKCLTACYYEKTGVIKNGKVVADALKANVMKEYPGGNANGFVTECQGVNHGQRCELGALVNECVNKAAVKFGPK